MMKLCLGRQALLSAGDPSRGNISIPEERQHIHSTNLCVGPPTGSSVTTPLGMHPVPEGAMSMSIRLCTSGQGGVFAYLYTQCTELKTCTQASCFSSGLRRIISLS